MKSKTASRASSTSSSRTVSTSFRKSSMPVISLWAGSASSSRARHPQSERENMNEPITEKNPKPPGLLPKNVQSWLLVSIALGMVLIMWITGGKNPPATPKAGVAVIPVPAPVEINETKIAELQSRIQELQREQLVAQSALAQQNRLLGAAPQDFTAAAQSYSGNNAQNERIQDPILTERKRRDYLSLFASNVAVTYRKNA